MVHIHVSHNTQNQPKHLPKLGWFIYLLAIAAMIGGFLYGYNSGVVSPALIYLQQDDDMKPMKVFWQELVISITPGMAGLSALPAGLFSDKFGRKKVIISSSIIYAVGALICAFAFSKWSLLIGRIFIGLGLGLSSMTVPIYVGEASPLHIRGKLLTCYQLFLGTGIVAGNVVGGGLSYVNPVQIGWRLMLGFAAIPALIQFISFLFLPESPRYLYEQSSTSDIFIVENVLKRIFNNDNEWVKYELEEIQTASEKRQREKAMHHGNEWIIWKILKTPHIRTALFIGCTLQIFQQFAGVNAILYYTTNIIKADGVKDPHTTIWISVGTAFMNLIGIIVPMFLIERLGRRKILLGSVIGTFISLLLLGAGFLVMNKTSADVIILSSSNRMFNSTTKNYDTCMKFSNCDFCVTNENCGFCSAKGSKDGFCLPVNKNDPDNYASTGYCDNQKQNITHTWSQGYCQTNYTIWVIVCMFIYLLFFGAGYAPLPWVLNSEFYPMWASGTCVSIATFCHWIANLVITLTFLSLNEAITKYGSFFLYAGITLIALILYLFFVPETSGLEIEEVEKLFMSKSKQKRLAEESSLARHYTIKIPLSTKLEKI